MEDKTLESIKKGNGLPALKSESSSSNTTSGLTSEQRTKKGLVKETAELKKKHK
ncbi:MAG: hypothetical protein ACLTYJ_01655 [Merdibacter sp.]